MILRTFTRNLLVQGKKSAAHIKPVEYAVCIDIECTCDSPIQINPMEVIELACLKLDLTAKKPPEAVPMSYPAFHSYVRPVINPNLTLFCQDLTGIMQSTVDKSEPIDKVLEMLMKWLRDEELIDDKNEKRKEFAFASCGNFDLNLLSTVFKDGHELPIYFKEWINVKKTFFNHKKRWPRTLYHMMELLGKEPHGRLHSARDDCFNLARIVECLYRDQCEMYVTSKLS